MPDLPAPTLAPVDALIDFDLLLRSLGAPQAAAPPSVEALLSEPSPAVARPDPVLPELPLEPLASDPFAELERGLREFDQPRAPMPASEWPRVEETVRVERVEEPQVEDIERVEEPQVEEPQVEEPAPLAPLALLALSEQPRVEDGRQRVEGSERPRVEDERPRVEGRVEETVLVLSEPTRVEGNEHPPALSERDRPRVEGRVEGTRVASGRPTEAAILAELEEWLAALQADRAAHAQDPERSDLDPLL